MATKIGVYFDQSAIGGGLDVESLVEGVENRWSDLALVVKAFPQLAATAARLGHFGRRRSSMAYPPTAAPSRIPAQPDATRPPMTTTITSKTRTHTLAG